MLTVVQHICIRWSLTDEQPRTGVFEVTNGRILKIIPKLGSVLVDNERLTIRGDECVVEIHLEGGELAYGPRGTIVKWSSNIESFTFLPGMLATVGVIAVPDFGVEISSIHTRQTEQHLNERKPLLPKGRDIGLDYWTHKNSCPPAPTVLGVYRDQRFFQIDLHTEEQEAAHSAIQIKASRDLFHTTIGYSLSYASKAGTILQRSLEDGIYPILHWLQDDGCITIEETAFASFKDRALEPEAVSGTPFAIAQLYSVNATFPEGVAESTQEFASAWRPSEELVLFIRTKLSNSTDTAQLVPHRLPRAKYIYRAAVDNIHEIQKVALSDEPHLDDDGVAWYDGVPYSRHKIDGLPASFTQPCFLLAPGQCIIVESVLAHDVAGLRRETLSREWDWKEKLEETRSHWLSITDAPGTIDVPEERLNQFWKAGHCHLELLTLGRDSSPDPLLAKVGVYSAIGSESLPIVEFYDSIGLHDTAKRCIDAFFAYQHSTGRINLYSYYDIETGAVLYMAGRHFSYTNDKAWVRARSSHLKAAAYYIIGLRNTQDTHLPVYGLVSGTSADPVEPVAAYMLNAYNAAGLDAAATMLAAINDPSADDLRDAAESYRQSIHRAVATSFSNGPLVPIGPERWVPSCSPSAGKSGLQYLCLDGRETFSHRSYGLYDALIGPLWMTYLGILPLDSSYSRWLLDVTVAQFNRSAVAESQPYYSRHPEILLLSGEREAFLNAFYSALAASADPDTFTFWEHLHKISVHKTHEEGWALMQLRRMLWLESDGGLRLLPGIPLAWLDAGQCIKLDRVSSYFGSFSLRVKRSEDKKSLTIEWLPSFHTAPGEVLLYLPGLWANTKDARLELLEDNRIAIREATSPLTIKLNVTSEPFDPKMSKSESRNWQDTATTANALSMI